MDHLSSSSSTKISGIPLIPPLVTNDIPTEIQYYKQLAIAVEERLKVLELAKESALKRGKDEPNRYSVQVPTADFNVTVDGAFKFQNDFITPSTTSSTTATMDFPTKDDNEVCLIDISTPVTEKEKNESLLDKDINVSEPKQKHLEQIEKFISEEDKSCLNDTLLGDSVSSDTVTASVTASTDLNQYMNTSASTRTDTTETTPENWKPQVPKTLNIVPITVDQSKQPDKSGKADEETPKLVRRGSYVLDTPSPMLLAHMQNDFTNSDYTPSSSAQSTKRKEWSISQVKTDWETQSKTKEPASSRSNSSVNKFRKNSQSHIPSQRVSKSVSNSKSGSPLDVYQPAKSVDCIQTMFAKECYSPKTGNSRASNQNHKYSSPVNGTNGIRNNGTRKAIKTPSILSLANKLSGSLGSLSNNVSPKPVKRVEKKNVNDTNVKKSLDQESVKSNESATPSSITKKQKPVITSEKIVTVFKEIQETHKKQMIELMSRQQKEQMLMQENFKKQQILLLAQIRKAFPEISILSLSEAITGKNPEHATPLSSKTENEKSNSSQKQKTLDASQQVNGISCYEQHEQTAAKLPIDSHHSLSSKKENEKPNSSLIQTTLDTSQQVNGISCYEQHEQTAAKLPVDSHHSLSSKKENEKPNSSLIQTTVDASQQVNAISCYDKHEQTAAKLPIDCGHPSRELSSCYMSNQYQNSCQTFDNSAMMIGRSQLSNIKDIDDIPVGIPMRRHSSVSRQLFPHDCKTPRVPIFDTSSYTQKHIKAATIINAYARGFLVRRLMKTEKVIALKNTYREALHCMLRLHVDAPLNLPELNFHQRLQLQCDAASMNIVDLFSQSPTKRMEIIAHDRDIKKARSDRPSSARSYSFATQRTLARKKLKEMGIYPSLQSSVMSKSCPARTRCQTWTSNTKERKTTTSLYQGIKRSTSAGAVRKPWR